MWVDVEASPGIVGLHEVTSRPKLQASAFSKATSST